MDDLVFDHKERFGVFWEEEKKKQAPQDQDWDPLPQSRPPCRWLELPYRGPQRPNSLYINKPYNIYNNFYTR